MRINKNMLLTLPAAFMIGYLLAVVIKRCTAPIYIPESTPSVYLDDKGHADKGYPRKGTLGGYYPPPLLKTMRDKQGQLEDKMLSGNGSAGYPPPRSKTVWEKIADHYGLPWSLCR